jgi:hypothetical protein
MTVTISTRPATARDLAVNAAVLGVAAMAWFGWARQAPPAGWPVPLGVGSGLGAVLAVLAGVSAWRVWHSGSAMARAGGRRTYHLAVGAEAAVIAAGVVTLVVTGQSAYVAPWVLGVVGAHFLPLSRLFAIRDLAVAGWCLVVVAVVAVFAGLLGTVAPSAVAGAAGGLILVVAAARSLVAARR